jgi:hypothetical protein
MIVIPHDALNYTPLWVCILLVAFLIARDKSQRKIMTLLRFVIACGIGFFAGYSIHGHEDYAGEFTFLFGLLMCVLENMYWKWKAITAVNQLPSVQDQSSSHHQD